MLEQAVQDHAGGTLLRVRATPNAARTTVEGLRDTAGGARVALRVKAPPVDGKANAEVLRWAAEFFDLRKSAVTLLRGDKAREKDLLLAGMSAADARARLAAALPAA
jgi:uncharacterized protein (TIGR00251 family)